MWWHIRRNQISSFGEKRTSPFKSAGASVLSTTGRRVVHISGSNAGYTMLRGSVMGTGYPLHSPVSPSLSLPCVTVCHHVSTGLYKSNWLRHVTGINKKRMPKIMLNYRPNGRRRLGRPLRRLLDEAETGLSRPNSWRMMMIMIMMNKKKRKRKDKRVLGYKIVILPSTRVESWSRGQV
jgi:hypothetical protein